MARQRGQKQRTRTRTEATTTNETPTETTERRGLTVATTALTPEQIQELLAKVTVRGEYGREMEKFINSGENGVQVSLSEGAFSGRKAQAVKIGFDNARKSKNAPKGAENVRVLKDEENIFLLRAESDAPAEEAA